jgi:hypothetical protein
MGSKTARDITTRQVADEALQRSASDNSGGATIWKAGFFTFVDGVATVTLPDVPSTGIVVFGGSVPNASTALGIPFVTALGHGSMTVTSLEVTTPASTQVGDQSTYNYAIIVPE